MKKMEQTEQTTPAMETEQKEEVLKNAETFAGVYRVSTALNMRAEAKADAEVLAKLPVDLLVSCDGGYAMDNGIRYLHIKAKVEGKEYTGFCQVRFLIKTAYKEVL